MKWIWFHEKKIYEDFDAYARSWMTWISWRLTLQRGGTDNFSNNFLKKILSDKNVLRKDNLLIMKKQHYISQILSASFKKLKDNEKQSLLRSNSSKNKRRQLPQITLRRDTSAASNIIRKWNGGQVK